MARIHLFTRADCCLCDDAKEVLERVRRDHPFELTVVDVDSDREIAGMYGQLIPVITIDGEKAFHFYVNEKALRRRLSEIST